MKRILVELFSFLCRAFLSGYSGKISQMPIILTPLHFDRDPLLKQPSCRRSVVVRTFITSDFMTGIPAMPGNHIPEEVNHDSTSQLGFSVLLESSALSCIITDTSQGSGVSQVSSVVIQCCFSLICAHRWC